MLPEKRNRVENPSRISPTWSPPAAATVDARLENCFGFDDVDENGNQKTPSPKHTTIEHHLPEIRKNLKRFLHRPVIEKPSKKRKRSPRKNIAQPSTSKSFFDELQAEANKSDSDSSDEIRIEQPMKQRDIRAAFNPCNYVDYTDKRKKDEPNIFGETETERVRKRVIFVLFSNSKIKFIFFFADTRSTTKLQSTKPRAQEASYGCLLQHCRFRIRARERS